LEPAGIGSAKHGGSFWQLLKAATPVAQLLPKPCRANPTSSQVRKASYCCEVKETLSWRGQFLCGRLSALVNQALRSPAS